jgi:hypothetical protein
LGFTKYALERQPRKTAYKSAKDNVWITFESILDPSSNGNLFERLMAHWMNGGDPKQPKHGHHTSTRGLVQVFRTCDA